MESPGRSSSVLLNSPSPEFEFSYSSPTTLLSADQLFSHGFLLPLHLLPKPEPDPCSVDDSSSSSASITSSSVNPILTASKRWKEIFKRGDKKPDSNNLDNIPIDKRREKKNASINTTNSASAELNINIWPFSRSRSAGNNTGRSKPAGSNRKVSSAPCSRSNSSGSRRSSWPNSPGRTGVHIGRTSPVWQVKKNRTGSDRIKAAGKGVNVPTCIGYRQQLSCRSDENAAVGRGRRGDDGRGGGGGNGNINLFSLRGLFSKKSVLTA